MTLVFRLIQWASELLASLSIDTQFSGCAAHLFRDDRTLDSDPGQSSAKRPVIRDMPDSSGHLLKQTLKPHGSGLAISYHCSGWGRRSFESMSKQLLEGHSWLKDAAHLSDKLTSHLDSQSCSECEQRMGRFLHGVYPTHPSRT